MSPAAASVGEPLISSSPVSAVGTFSALRWSTSDLAMVWPIASLLKET